MNKIMNFINQYRAFIKHEFLDVFVAGLTIVVHGVLLFVSVLPIYMLWKGMTTVIDKTIPQGTTLYFVIAVIGFILSLGFVFWLIGAPTKDDKAYDDDY